MNVDALTSSLHPALERLLRASDEARPKHVRNFVAAAREAAQVEDPQRIVRVFAQSIVPTLDYTSAQSLFRAYRALRLRHGSGGLRLRFALLGSANTDQLASFVELFLFAAGIDVDLYTSDYGVFRQEILDPASRLHEFQPQVVYLATSWRDLSHVPTIGDSREQVCNRVEAELADWSQLWRVLHERLHCQVVQDNFVAPPWRFLGNHEVRHAGGFARYVALVNQAFADRGPNYVTVHDAAGLGAAHGIRKWADERFYHHAKLPCAPECLAEYAHSLSSIIAAQFGLGRKCLVLDLDNTLWGGVIGDDGLAGIRLGQGEAEGEAFYAFQHYVKGLQTRGVILAVCSKNDDGIAREAFEKHPGMLLRPGDIACFMANWDDKPNNLRTIARRLNIGLNSLVFVDDNPAERALVRQTLPEVATPELPDDPAGYTIALDRHRYFEVTSIGVEDLQRTGYYRENIAREIAEESAATLDDFLHSLDMKVRIAPVSAENAERCAQLINRSNQFNLTTRRRTKAEVEELAARTDWVTAAVTLSDRFGDNGLISVVLARIDEDELEIDTWLMSCRVLKRGVEACLLNHLVDQARSRGLSKIRGSYLPTPKNALVKDHYAALGFAAAGVSAAGATEWELSLSVPFEPRAHYIRQIDVASPA